MGALDRVTEWPANTAAAATLQRTNNDEVRVTANVGDIHASFRLASLAKVVTALTALIAVEEGSVTLDDTITNAPPGVNLHTGTTLRHLLSHASGLPFDGGTPVAALATRRVYSNTGIETAAAVIADATGIAFNEYLAEAVLQPLGMARTELRGSPAYALWSTVGDVTRLLGELMQPTLISHDSAHDMQREQFEGLGGVIPGLGKFAHCPWGLGAEIRGSKDPHWTGRTNSPDTFGHFGGAGTMMWVDPVAACALVALTDLAFDEWPNEAIASWRELSDAVLDEHRYATEGAR